MGRERCSIKIVKIFQVVHRSLRFEFLFEIPVSKLWICIADDPGDKDEAFDGGEEVEIGDVKELSDILGVLADPPSLSALT